jgi:hypothetical protein
MTSQRKKQKIIVLWIIIRLIAMKRSSLITSRSVRQECRKEKTNYTANMIKYRPTTEFANHSFLPPITPNYTNRNQVTLLYPPLPFYPSLPFLPPFTLVYTKIHLSTLFTRFV